MSEDDDFLQQFEGRTLPLDQWHHRAHLKVAYLYLTTLDFDAAAQRIRDGIRAYNAANNIQDTPTGGYHETMTMAWLHLIAATLSQYGSAASADEFFDSQPQLTQKKILRLFYSPGRFMSPAAKTTFLEPDLTALPAVRRIS